MTRFSLAALVVLAPIAFAPVPAHAQMTAADLVMRLDRLEAQVRQLTGTVEQLQFRNQQLEQQLDVEKLLVRPKATIYIHRRAARYQELKQWAQERREEARSE